MFRKADRIIVLGAVWRDLIATRVPEAADRIVIMANAVPRPALPQVPGALEDIVIHNETGLLVQPGDAEALAAALKLLILDPNWGAGTGRGRYIAPGSISCLCERSGAAVEGDIQQAAPALT